MQLLLSAMYAYLAATQQPPNHRSAQNVPVAVTRASTALSSVCSAARALTRIQEQQQSARSAQSALSIPLKEQWRTRLASKYLGHVLIGTYATAHISTALYSQQMPEYCSGIASDQKSYC